jgi:hypothetical protein
MLWGCGSEVSEESQPRGEAVLRVHVTAKTSDSPVADATIRIFADQEKNCAEQGPLTAEVVTDASGAFRVQSEGLIRVGGTCFSLGVLPPAGAGLQPSERVPFLLEFRSSPPLDSVQVEVALESEP